MSNTESLRYACLTTLLFSLLCCCGQTNNTTSIESNKTGGAFENAEYMAIGMPATITAIDTSAGWAQNGQKLLITGTIYKRDGITPAPNILLYYYHTNTEGRYLHQPGELRSMPPNKLGQTHGYIRGWIKSDAKGSYAIYTVKPGTYPSRDEPAHIHLSIKEPHLKESYYIDELVFDDDELLTTAKRRKLENRGGSGVLRLVQHKDLLVAEHNIVLGLHIPGYPEENKNAIQSGLEIGEDQPSFIPHHAFGPDKGSRACPVCKYGRYHGIIYFIGNRPNWINIKKWLVFLERESIARGKYLKSYFVYGNENGYSREAREKELEQTGKELQLQNLALTYVPSFTDTESEIQLSKINADVVNTFIVYRNGTIIGKFINLQPTEENFNLLSALLDNTKSKYFHLPNAIPH